MNCVCGKKIVSCGFRLGFVGACFSHLNPEKNKKTKTIRLPDEITRNEEKFRRNHPSVLHPNFMVNFGASIGRNSN